MTLSSTNNSDTTNYDLEVNMPEGSMQFNVDCDLETVTQWEHDNERGVTTVVVNPMKLFFSQADRLIEAKNALKNSDDTVPEHLLNSIVGYLATQVLGNFGDPTENVPIAERIYKLIPPPTA